MPEHKSHGQKAGEWTAYNAVAVPMQYGLNLLIDSSHKASNVFNYTDSNWVGLSNLMGLTVVDTVHALYIICAEEDKGAKFAKLLRRIPGNIIAAEAAEAIYLGVNRYYFNRDITTVDNWEKAAVRTLGTSVVRLATSGIYKGLQACGLFSKKSAVDSDLDAELLDRQERGYPDRSRYNLGPKTNF